MLALLSPRVLILLAVLAALAFSHYQAFRKGKHVVRTEWIAATAASNEEARRLERARQSAADAAGALSAARQGRIAADSARLRGELGGLRDALDAAERAAAQSVAAASQYRDTCRKLLLESGELLTEIARAADAHSSDVKLLQDAWPTNSPN